MKNLKKILFLLTIAVGAKADVADEILKYTNLVDQLCKPLKPSDDPKKRGNRERCDLLVGVGKDAYRISRNVESFINTNLSKVSQKGDELIALLKCMDKGGMATAVCQAKKCDSENACIALILKTTKELLEPVIKDLIASSSAPGRYDNGALFNLANLSFLPKPKPGEQSLGQKMATEVVSMADTLNSSLDFMNSLAIILSPQAYLAATPSLPQAEKDKIAAVEPIQLPANTEIDPNLDLGDL